MDPDPKSYFKSQLGTEVVGVIGMFYPRQNSVLTLYFALGIMGVVGTADIGAFQLRVQPTAKSATASLHFEANHQNGEWKTLKKIIGGKFYLFATEKVLGLRESYD